MDNKKKILVKSFVSGLKQVNEQKQMKNLQPLDMLMMQIYEPTDDEYEKKRLVEGFNVSEGKSFNVWGYVPFPEEIIDKFNNVSKEYAKTGKLNRLCIWTAYDRYVYDLIVKNPDIIFRKQSFPNIGISATYKSCFDRFTAIADNMGYKFMEAMELPTSYNYLVAFDKNLYPEIINNYKDISKKSKVINVGVVSVDFLQVVDTENTSENMYSISGDELLTMCELLPSDLLYSLSDEKNYIGNWIVAIEKYINNECKDFKIENIEYIEKAIKSRLARSCLAKEALGDSDFVIQNCGIIVNEKANMIRFNPNFDFGELFNNLRQEKFNDDNNLSKEMLDSLPESVRNVLITQMQKPKRKKTVEELACQYASQTSERNIEYCVKNEPEATREFFESYDKIISSGKYREIVYSYTKIAVDEKPILKLEEAELICDYIKRKAEFMIEKYIDISNKFGLKKYLPVEYNSSCERNT